MESYLSIQENTTAEYVVKKSRFIAHCSHVENEQQAIDFLNKIREQHSCAKHNVYAYSILENNRIRHSDDGEPAKTAGLPILQIIQHQGLSNVIVVVTRYFGGILLGTGGLARAYSHVAKLALEKVPHVCYCMCVDVKIDLSYTHYNQLEPLLRSGIAKQVEITYLEQVQLVLRVKIGNKANLLNKLQELLAGSGNISEGEAHFQIM